MAFLIFFMYPTCLAIWWMYSPSFSNPYLITSHSSLFLANIIDYLVWSLWIGAIRRLGCYTSWDSLVVCSSRASLLLELPPYASLTSLTSIILFPSSLFPTIAHNSGIKYMVMQKGLNRCLL